MVVSPVLLLRLMYLLILVAAHENRRNLYSIVNNAALVDSTPLLALISNVRRNGGGEGEKEGRRLANDGSPLRSIKT